MLRLPLLLSLLLAIGCGVAGDGMVAVTGVVHSADGSAIPMESGTILFIPVDGARSANGSIEPDGSFTMMTQKPGDGVEPGDYKVILNIWKDYETLTPAVPERYADPQTTSLEATVDEDHTRFEFVVDL